MSLLAVQAEIYSTLSGDSTLSELVTGVFDVPPQESSFPYVVIGDDQTEDAGTKTEDLREFTLQIHTWTQYRGRKTCKEIQERIRSLLHRADLTPGTGTIVRIREEFSDAFVDEDGVTVHGVQRFGLLFQT